MYRLLCKCKAWDRGSARARDIPQSASSRPMGVGGRDGGAEAAARYRQYEYKAVRDLRRANFGVTRCEGDARRRRRDFKLFDPPPVRCAVGRHLRGTRARSRRLRRQRDGFASSRMGAHRALVIYARRARRAGRTEQRKPEERDY